MPYNKILIHFQRLVFTEILKFALDVLTSLLLGQYSKVSDISCTDLTLG